MWSSKGCVPVIQSKRVSGVVRGVLLTLQNSKQSHLTLFALRQVANLGLGLRFSGLRPWNTICGRHGGQQTQHDAIGKLGFSSQEMGMASILASMPQCLNTAPTMRSKLNTLIITVESKKK